MYEVKRDIKNLKISNFRGINSLDWIVDGRFLCLIGPGDSTKSTILEAIELVLTPRRNVTFDDTDFYNANIESPIVIEMTTGEIPADLLSEAKFGDMVRGWDGAAVQDEPMEQGQPLLTIQLRVDQTLEPSWLVVNDRDPEGKRISSFDRAKFGASRIRDYADWQFSWGSGSTLAKLMEDREDVRTVLAAARRQAKASLDPDELPLFKISAQKAEAIGKKLGVAARTENGFAPHLDVRNINIGTSILALHDGPIPMRQSGLGTSRLLTLGLQHEAGRAGGVTLIDEVEHGLEPHRLRRLLHVLRTGIRLQENGEADNAAAGNIAGESTNQVFLTTHAPVALCELEPADLRVVRSDNGITDIKRPDDGLRPLFRTNPEAFLARKVIVCEGKTELGFCIALDKWWSIKESPFAYAGVALADGQGNTKGPTWAINFANLGYRATFFGDSDDPPNPGEDELEVAGVCTILWTGEVSIEERVALDLPWDGFVKMANLAIDERGEDHVRAKLAHHFNIQPAEVPVDPEEWRTILTSEEEIRSAFGKVAKAKKAEWFKRVDKAVKLGEIVTHHWEHIADKPLGIGIQRLKDWVYD